MEQHAGVVEVTDTALEYGRLYGTRQAAALLGVSVETLASWRWRGVGPSYIKVGSRVMYRGSAIDAYLARHEVSPAD